MIQLQELKNIIVLYLIFNYFILQVFEVKRQLTLVLVLLRIINK